MATPRRVVFQDGLEKDFPKMIPKHCEVCRKTDSLMRCSGCSVYYYCTRDHQAHDWPTHKPTCKQISAKRKDVQAEEDKIRARGGLLPWDDPNVNGVFWRHAHLRPYLQAKFLYGEFLVRSWRRQGVEDSLKEYLDILRRNRPDNQGARDSVPGLSIRLGQDQEAYDLIYWWGRKTTQKGFDWADLSQPFLDDKNVDATGPVDFWCPCFLQLTPVVALYLIKFRLLQNLKGIKRLRETTPPGSPTPTREEILSVLKDKYQCVGNTIDHQPVVDFYHNESLLAEKTNHLLQQMTQLYHSADNYNKHMWRLITDPTEEAFSALPAPYTPGSWNEAQIVFAHLYSAWAESVAAVPALRKVIGNAKAATA